MTDRVLITGGAGFIGANLIRRLQQQASDVSVFDDLSRGHLEYLPDPAMLRRGDILDRDALLDAMTEVDAVIHLAAYGSVVESVESPEPNFDTNVRGIFNVLDCARLSGVKRFIFASTGGALIGDAEPPVDETSLPKPISPYGASKLCGEAYCHAFAKAYGMGTVALRFANVYGPYSGHKKGAVTKFIKCIFRGEPITVFGDGSSTRDYLHVEDLCDGIARALNADVPPGEVFHIASGQETSVLTLARTICAIAGAPDHPMEHLPPRSGEVDRNFARYEKANRTLGFAPTRTLEDGLRETWAWYLEHRDEVLSIAESDS